MAARPWSQAWIDASRLPPLLWGLLLAAAHLLSGVLFHAAVGRDATDSQLLASTLVFALLVGFGPAALAMARRQHRATLEALRPHLAGPAAELECEEARVQAFSRGWLRFVGAVSAMGAVGITLFTTDLAAELGRDDPRLGWVVWQNALAFWLANRTVAHDLAVSHRLSRLCGERLPVDLFDRAPMAPLARRGLASALLIILGVSIFSLVYGLDNLSPTVPATQGLAVALAGLALVLPSLGVHRRLRAQKVEELAEVGRHIRDARASRADPERLATLLSLRQHLESAREWPFDLGTLGRFALVSAIGLGSWLGAALVERLLDLVVG